MDDSLALMKFYLDAEFNVYCATLIEFKEKKKNMNKVILFWYSSAQFCIQLSFDMYCAVKS